MGFWLQGFQCRDKESDVTTGCPGKLGELGRDRDSTFATETCWLRVATETLCRDRVTGKWGLKSVMTETLCHNRGGYWAVATWILVS